ncbi:MAG: DUF1565 domain-containing protein [Myxococcales bacterium]|nr:DUF1565 domain-containing protein [Myxococcales bacterium]
MRTGWRAAVGTGVFLFLVIFLSLAGGCGTPDDSSSSADSEATVDDDHGSPPGSIQENDDNEADDDSADDDDDAADDDSGDDDVAACGYAPLPTNENGVFVSADTGNDDNPGTMQAPKKTIAAAIPLAYNAGQSVFVAGGRYEESVLAKVSVFGGYRAANWTRDIEAVRTIVAPPFQQKFVINNDEKGKTIVLEGMEIHGSADTNNQPYNHTATSAAVTVDSEAAVLSCNKLVGGSVVDIGGMAGAISAAVQVVAAPSLLLVDNLLQGGPAFGIIGAESIGLWIDAPSHQVVAKRNVIRSGLAVGPVIGGAIIGVSVSSLTSSAKTVLIANEIRAESPSAGAKVDEAVAVGSYGLGKLVMIANSVLMKEAGYDAAIVAYGPIVLLQNTIFSENEWPARSLWLADTATLVDNVFVASGDGASRFIEVNNDAHQLRFFANDFYDDSPGFSFVYHDTFAITDLAEFNACQWAGCAAAAGNISVDPLLAGANDVHLQTGSPCIDQGVDPSSWYDGDAIHFDLDGDPRPQGAGWDIGADEAAAR